MNSSGEKTSILDKILTVSIVILFITMFGITNLNVFMRFAFNRPIIISVELARYCFVALIYIGAIITTKRDKHISLDFFVNYMPIKVRRALEQLGRILVAVFYSIFCYYAIIMVVNNTNVKSSAMQISMAIVYSPLVIGSIGIVIESLINIYRYGSGMRVKLSELEEVELQMKNDKEKGEIK